MVHGGWAAGCGQGRIYPLVGLRPPTVRSDVVRHPNPTAWAALVIGQGQALSDPPAPASWRGEGTWPRFFVRCRRSRGALGALLSRRRPIVPVPRFAMSDLPWTSIFLARRGWSSLRSLPPSTRHTPTLIALHSGMLPSVPNIAKTASLPARSSSRYPMNSTSSSAATSSETSFKSMWSLAG